MDLPLSNMGLDMCLLGLLSQVENSKPVPNMAFNCTIEKLSERWMESFKTQKCVIKMNN